MRAIEPHQFKKIKDKRKKAQRPRPRFVLPLIVLIGIFVYVLFAQQRIHAPRIADDQQASSEQTNAPSENDELNLKILDGEGFKELYTTFAYPNTQPLEAPPTITGNADADARIHDIAIRRGYELSSVPVANIVKIDEPYLTDDDLLQQNAKLGWDGLTKAADQDNIPLQITSAYRSIEMQRGLFLQYMRDAGISAAGIADGYSDAAVSKIMERVAPPGYSRHHNGYTIDLACDGVGLYGFKSTSCYRWISKDNFKIAKEHGWVPSYPEEAKQQGPEPEPWEFIWVGTINLYE